MTRLVTAEFRKLATTRLWAWLLLGCVALTALFTSLAIGFAGDPDNPTPALSTRGGQQTVFSTGQRASTLVAVLAAVGITAELRHKTLSATFLAAPRRARVLVAKLATYAAVGLAYGLLAGYALALAAAGALARARRDIT